MSAMLKAFLLIYLIYYVISAKITQKNRQYVDEFGRTRIFHGVNVVYKVAPYIPSTGEFNPLLSFNDEDIKVHMKKFGFNIVRLGVMWEAIETAPGVYNLDLLEKFYNLVNKLGEHGIYTIVDAHQDLFSRDVCGEGVPHFYVKELDYDRNCKGTYLKELLSFMGVCKGIEEYGYKTDENGLPLIEECKRESFAKYHTSPDLTSLYEKLYNNEKGLLDKFIKFWIIVAQKFKNNPYVLGYDIWNEPIPGGLYDHPSSLIPGKPDDDQMLPFYRKIDESIRQVDPEYTLMFEPTPFPDNIPYLWSKIKGTFSDTPLKTSELHNKQIYNYHSYCCLATAPMCESGEPPLDQADYCRKFHINNVKNAEEYSSKFGIGTIISEFGACKNSESCYHEISSVADAADQYLMSWAYWMYKPFEDFTTSCPNDKEGMFNEDGSIQEYKVKALTRSYVQAFQGIGQSMYFDKESKVLTFQFNVDYEIKQPTEVYINRQEYYKDGVDVKVESVSHDNVEIDESEENLVKITLIKQSKIKFIGPITSQVKITVSPVKRTNLTLLN